MGTCIDRYTTTSTATNNTTAAATAAANAGAFMVAVVITAHVDRASAGRWGCKGST